MRGVRVGTAPSATALMLRRPGCCCSAAAGAGRRIEGKQTRFHSASKSLGRPGAVGPEASARARSTATTRATAMASSGGEGPCLLWFKNDLRVTDHPGLLEAASRSGGSVVPVFIFDPEVYSPHLESESDVKWLREALVSLKRKLRALDSDLLVEIGRVEDVLPALCERFSVASVVTEREADCLWADKVADINRSIGCELKTYTYTMFGENTGWQYPLVYAELEQGWEPAAPLSAPAELSGEGLRGYFEGATIPAVPDLYAAMVDAWAGRWGEANPIPAPTTCSGIAASRSAYCSPEVLAKAGRRAGDFSPSGDRDEAMAELRSYLAAFSGGEAPEPGTLESAARALEVPGGFGQSFSLFRKHLSHGLVSPSEIHETAREFKVANSGPMAEISGALTGAKAAMAAAVKYDFHGNLHRYSLGKERMSEGVEHKSWKWRGAHQEFVVASPSNFADEAETAVVLIHGFGAMGEHWRDNAAGLQREGFRVYCPTLPGYGRSEKVSAQYTPQLWSQYVKDFISVIVGEPVFIAGNSIGGYISAYTAAKNPNLCRGLILVNTAGRLVEDTAELPFQESSVTEEDSPLEAARKTVVAEIGSRLIFKYLEGNVPSLLEKAYTNVPARADSKLVREIERASSDPGAFDVFKSVFYLPAPTPLSSLIKEYPGDVWVFQGVNDPLNDAAGRAKQMEQAGAKVELVEGGHTPHDELPGLFNDFVASVAGGD